MQFVTHFQCDLCGGFVPLSSSPVVGVNMADATCPHCGERWHWTYHLLSLEPPVFGEWALKRSIGVVRDNVFYPKEQLQ